MATYAKILKDTSGNQILPYTRSKLVYMDDGSTVEEAVNRPATNTQMGRVIIGNGLSYDGYGTISLGRIGITSTLGYVPVRPTDYGSKSAHGIVQVGSNINVKDGTISINDTNIKEALGYTPASNDAQFQIFTYSDFGKDKNIGRIDANSNLLTDFSTNGNSSNINVSVSKYGKCYDIYFAVWLLTDLIYPYKGTGLNFIFTQRKS